MKAKNTWGGRRAGAGGSLKKSPALIAARNVRVGRRVLRERAKNRTEGGPIAPSRWLEAVLRDVELPAGASELDEYFFYYAHLLETEGSLLRDAWLKRGARILASWVRRNPGTRPRCWWYFAAPRQPAGLNGHLPEIRLRLGGKGRPTCNGTEFELGWPIRWEADGFDESDPPIFESSAAFLRRHGLLAPAEARRLSARDFKPEALPPELRPNQEGKTYAYGT